MNFEFSDEQQQLHDSGRSLSDRAIHLRQVSRHQRIRRGLGQSAFGPAWRSSGCSALNVPADQGGLGFGPLETLERDGRLRTQPAARARS